MTQEELDRLESLANAATGGSWEVGDPYDGRTALLVAVYGMGMEVADTQTEKDAAFIAAARDAVPSLIAEVRRLREENEALHSRILSGNLEDRSAIHQLQDVNLRHQEVNDRLRRILAALREPSEEVIEAMREHIYADGSTNNDVSDGIRAAVAAAEQGATS